jgi:hypothetical protein
MEGEKNNTDFQDRRTEPRRIIDRFFSVEFHVPDVAIIYQFKIWDISSKGICLLVKTDSEILKHMHPGDMLRMKYYPVDQKKPAEFLETKVIHITPGEQGQFEGHLLVGLSLQGEQSHPSHEGSVQPTALPVSPVLNRLSSYMHHISTEDLS